MKRMMMAAGAACALGGAAYGQVTTTPTPGAWSGQIQAGTDFSVDGDVHGGTSAPIEDLGGLNPDLAGVAATLEIGARSFDDIYDSGLVIDGQVAYGLSENAEVFGSLRFTALEDGDTQVGGAVVPALDATLPVFGEFGDYEAISLEGGYRYFFGDSGSTYRPYVAGRAGVVFVDSINATFTIPDADIAIENVAFYDSTTTYTVGVDLGLLAQVSQNGSIGVETGVRLVGDLEDDDTDIAGLGLAGINNEGQRISVPLLVTGRLTF